jgi:hypothetical protein
MTRFCSSFNSFSGSDTDEDKQESVTCSGLQEEVTKDTPAHVKAGQSVQQVPKTKI